MSYPFPFLVANQTVGKKMQPRLVAAMDADFSAAKARFSITYIALYVYCYRHALSGKLLLINCIGDW
jgi:hypothetical protein